jgi:hypothetical protein
MFQAVTLYPSHELTSMIFLPNKNYLLMIAQGCDPSFIADAPSTTLVYTITVPAVIWQSSLHHDALLCCELCCASNILFCQTENDASPQTILQSHTIMMFVDWMDPKIYGYLDKLFSLTSQNVTIMGAGCGRTDGRNLPIITRNKEALTNGFLVIFGTNASLVGSAHGSEFYRGHFIAQIENSNRITTINGESAFPFYQKIVQEHFCEEVTPENIFNIGLKYPFGLGGLNGEQALRVPASVENNSILVAGPMDEEVTICLMKSTPNTFLKASYMAIDTGKLNVRDLKSKECFVIECAGRYSLLGEDFKQELDAIVYEMHGASKIYGVLSLGEIANNASQYIEYFNESCVIGVLDAPQ